MAISLAVLMLVWAGDAKAGEIDGKALVCSGTSSSYPELDNTYILFKGGYVFNYYIFYRNGDFNLYSNEKRKISYTVEEDEVIWSYKNIDLTTVNRETLVLSHHQSLTKSSWVWDQQCRLTNYQGLINASDRDIEARKASMKKNKL